MFEEELHLRDYLHIIWKRRWLILAVLIPVVLGVTLTSFKYIPIYRATARILLEPSTPNITSFADPGSRSQSGYWYYPQFLETQINLLKSRELAKRVFEKLGTDSQPPQPAAPAPTDPPPSTPSSPIITWVAARLKTLNEGIAAVRNQLAQIPKLLGEQDAPPLSDAAQATVQEEQRLSGFLGQLTLTTVENSQMVDLSITARHPEYAAHLANLWVETFIEYSLESKVAASRHAIQWLVEEVETARWNVADAEAALQAYKEQHQIISLEGRENIVIQQLADLSAAVNAARITRLNLEAQYREIKRYQAAQWESFPQVMNNGMIQELRGQIARLEGELPELEKKYRDKHPTITAAQSQLEALQGKLTAEITRVISSLAREYELAQVQEQELEKALEQQKQEALDLNQKTITYGILANEVESARRIYNALLQRLNEATVTERLELTNIQMVNRAAIPTGPINQKRNRNIALAVVVGLALGISLAFFLEYWNDKILLPEDLKRHLDMPCLGIIPKVSSNNHSIHTSQTTASMVVAVEPKSYASEAYRALRTNVMFSLLSTPSSLFEQDGSVLLITSAVPSEGKSCIVANLGIAIAQSGSNTLIIDCDLRKPMIHNIFHISNKVGFTDMVRDIKTNGMKTAIKQTNIPNLSVIPCGTIPPNPSELLGTKLARLIIEVLAEKYDKILIDSPPVNSVTDPIILSQVADGVIFVIRAGEMTRDVVRYAKDQLRSAEAAILGGVLNCVDLKKNGYYYYQHYYDYYHYGEKDKRATNA